VAPAVEAAPPAEKKPRSIMDLFRNATGNDEEAAPAETQLAAVEQEKPARPARRQQQQQQQQEQPQPETQAQQPVTGSGFVVQLASFRSESEARKEYGRLSNLYPDVVGGLQQQIRQTSVGGSTRYQLGLGPLPSRSDATRVCSALITAGESDCIVRGR
jgi:cell division septation protein DedD